MIKLLNSQDFPTLLSILKRVSLIWRNWYKYILVVIFILGFIYIILPGPTKIEDFPSLIPSVKSDLEGDTVQNPNIAAYFSDFRRYFITDYYKSKFADMHWFGNIFPPITLNHPPEYAYQYVRDQQESTFLEEYVYPLRESFFVNGYEPLIENRMYKKASGFVGDHIIYKYNNVGREYYFDSKTTIRFYPNNIFSRIGIYLLIWISAFAVFKLFIRALKEE